MKSARKQKAKHYWEEYPVDPSAKPLPPWKGDKINLEDIKGPPFRSHLHGIFYRDNCYLISGYRAMPSYDYWFCFKSIFYLHNETLNIWSHVVACISWLIILAYITPTLIEEFSFRDRLPFILYCIGSVLVYAFSTVYHTIKCNSVEDYHWILHFDFWGIILILFNANILTPYFELYCFPEIQRLVLIFVVLFFIVLVYLVPPIIKYRYTNTRTALFTIYCFVGLGVWFLSAFYLHPRIQDHHYQSLKGMCVSYVILISGMIIRTIKFPERIWPRKFDIIAPSHFIWHILCAIPSYTAFFTFYWMHRQGQFGLCLK
jgi:adiponectin receptor